MHKLGYLIYSIVAATSISLCTYFVIVEWNSPYAGLISFITFFFSFFTYTLDHYFDSKKLKNKLNLHQRHVIDESQYKFALKGFALTVIVSLYFFILRPMHTYYIINAFMLAFLSGIYFLLVFKLRIKNWLKILLGGIILTFIIGGWSGMEAIHSLHYWLYLTFILLSIWSNLLILGYIDRDYDNKHLMSGSFNFTRPQLLVLFLFFGIYIFLMGSYNGMGQSWLFIPIAYSFILLIVKNGYLKGNSIRLLIDLCMLLPLLKWIWV
jgi:hypothetical protein